MLRKIMNAKLDVNTVSPVKTSPTFEKCVMRLVAVGLLWISTMCKGQAAWADGAFLQFDVSRTTSNATLSLGRGPLTFGTGAVRYDGGRAFRLSTTYTLPLAQDVRDTENWPLGWPCRC